MRKEDLISLPAIKSEIGVDESIFICLNIDNFLENIQINYESNHELFTYSY